MDNKGTYLPAAYSHSQSNKHLCCLLYLNIAFKSGTSILLLVKAAAQAGLCHIRAKYINPLVTNGFSHPYQLDESTFIFKGHQEKFLIFISFFDENHVSKQNRPRLDAAFCGVTFEAILFAYVP